MRSAIQTASSYNPLSHSWIFGLSVLVLLPALFFNQWMPPGISELALVGLLVILGLRVSNNIRLYDSFIYGPPLLLLLLLPVGLLITDNLSISLPRAYAFVANLALFWAVAAQGNTDWFKWTIPWLFLILGPILAITLLVTTDFNTTKFSFINQSWYALLPTGWRVFWDQEKLNPNMSAGLLALFWLPVVVLIWQGSSWQQRDLAKFVATFMLVILLLTQSRGALVAVTIALLAVIVLQSRHWYLFCLAIFIIVGLINYIVSPAVILEALTNHSEVFGRSSLAGRRELWEQAIYLIIASPLLGIGLGMVEPIIRDLYPVTTYGIIAPFDHVHNLYLQIGVEMGLIGLAAHIFLFVGLFKRLWQQAQNPPDIHRAAITLGLLGTLVTLLGHGCLDAIIASPYVAIVVWGLLGLMVAVTTEN